MPKVTEPVGRRAGLIGGPQQLVHACTTCKNRCDPLEANEIFNHHRMLSTGKSLFISTSGILFASPNRSLPVRLGQMPDLVLVSPPCWPHQPWGAACTQECVRVLPLLKSLPGLTGLHLHCDPMGLTWTKEKCDQMIFSEHLESLPLGAGCASRQLPPKCP